MTGGGFGFCATGTPPVAGIGYGMGVGRGVGRGGMPWGGGRGRAWGGGRGWAGRGFGFGGYAAPIATGPVVAPVGPTADQERAVLQQQADFMGQQLDAIRKRLDELAGQATDS
jgi:uncharacterized protein DUF5320